MVIGVIAGFFRFIQVMNLEMFSDSITHKIRMKYFQAVLKKDSKWFDANNPNELATKISKEC